MDPPSASPFAHGLSALTEDVINVQLLLAVALLNISRDQLDRSNETRRIAALWRALGAELRECTAVANCDDPLVVWAASSSPNVVWVAAGQMWKDDAWSCPSCGGVMQRPGEDWYCNECGFRRPQPSWALSGDHVLSVDVHVLDHTLGYYRLYRTLSPEQETSTIDVPIRIQIDWNRLAHLVRQ